MNRSGEDAIVVSVQDIASRMQLIQGLRDNNQIATIPNTKSTAGPGGLMGERSPLNNVEAPPNVTRLGSGQNLTNIRAENNNIIGDEQQTVYNGGSLNPTTPIKSTPNYTRMASTPFEGTSGVSANAPWPSTTFLGKKKTLIIWHLPLEFL